MQFPVSFGGSKFIRFLVRVHGEKTARIYRKRFSIVRVLAAQLLFENIVFLSEHHHT